MKTFMAKKEEQTPRWFVIDANGKVVGRVAVQAANILRGKHNPKFTAHVDTGDFVIVVNAAKCVFTGKKETILVQVTNTGIISIKKISS